MKRLFAGIAVTVALVVAGTAIAALEPGVYDPGNTGCPVATYANGVLHLAKNCPTPTNAAAGADITGLNGQTFVFASFTLASTSQCQGGSPRFNVVTSDGLFFLGCNNVTPTGNTYTFTAQTLAAAGNQVPFPTGTIQTVSLLLDVQGTADISSIKVNGKTEVPLVGPPTSKDQCKKGGWKNFNNPSFKNQGQCVSYYEHHKTHKHGNKHHENKR
jgi:hypothetical protein